MKVNPMTKKISAITLFVFMLQYIFNLEVLGLNTNPGYYHNYQLLTHMLIHKDILHISSNLLLLIVSAVEVEKHYKGIKFLSLYLISGIFGIILQIMIFTLMDEYIFVFGASGAVFGILTTSLLLNPKQKLNILGFNIPFILIGISLIISEIINCINFTNDYIGHFCHLGGMIGGLIFYLFNRK